MAEADRGKGGEIVNLSCIVLHRPTILLLMGVLFFCSFSEAGTQDAPERLRDPFWPVGYEPEGWGAPVAEVAEGAAGQGAGSASSVDLAWDAALAKVKMAGVSRKGNEVVVIINDRVRRVGSVVSVLHAGSRYRWRIDSVDKKGLLTLKRISVLPVKDNLNAGSTGGGTE
ncbi:hypothetical protein ACFLQY_01635 [Verrucomicrobiota bacterium]